MRSHIGVRTGSGGAAALALALLLTACVSSDAGSTSSSTPATAGAGSSSALPSPSRTTWGSTAYVTGTFADFNLQEGEVTTQADGSAHSRNGSFTYRLVSDDPRVAGTVTGTWNSDRWGSGPDDGALVQWGESTLTNDGGTWVGSWAGTMASPVGDMVSRWWRGTGQYEGLTFFFWMKAKDITDPTSTWDGVVYTGDPPPLPATS
ncbi:MAG: hypothetical protein GC157_07855 [Frankiales bacterium]|nr:hypothetical protein [Frankiales bacterium]